MLRLTSVPEDAASRTASLEQSLAAQESRLRNVLQLTSEPEEAASRAASLEQSRAAQESLLHNVLWLTALASAYGQLGTQAGPTETPFAGAG